MLDCGMRSTLRVHSDIYVSAPRYAAHCDHDAVVAALTRTYSQRGIAVRSEPTLPGGKRSDLAVSLDHHWTYIEVKTRNGARNSRGDVSKTKLPERNNAPSRPFTKTVA